MFRFSTAALLCIGLAILPGRAGAQDKAARLDAAGDPLPDAALFRFGTTRLQHAHNVSNLVFLPNSKALLSTGGDGHIGYWEMPTGRRSTAWPAPDFVAAHVLVCNDKKTLAAARGCRYHFFDMATGKEVRQFCPPDNNGGFLSPDGTLLGAVGGPAQVNLWLWDTTTGKCHKYLDGAYRDCRALVFCAESKLMVMGGTQRGLELWDVAAAKLRHRLEELPGTFVSALFAPDGKTVIASCTKGVQVFDTATGQQVRRFAEANLWADNIALSADGKMLALSWGDGAIALWDPTTGKEIRRCSDGGPAGSITGVALSPDGKYLAARRFNDASIYLFDTATGKPLVSRSGHGGSLHALAVSTEGKWAATVARDRSVRLWDLTAYKEVRRITPKTGTALCVAFSTDSRTLAAGIHLNSNVNHVQLWDVDTGKERRSFGSPGKEIVALAFAPDGKRLATAGGGDALRVWDPNSGNELLPLPIGKTGYNSSLAYSADGTRLISGHYDSSVRFWDVEDGNKLRAKGTHKGSVLAVAIAANGKLAASGAADGTARLWDVDTGKELRTFTTQQERVVALALAPDGRWLATAANKAVHIWETASGKLLGEYAGHASWVRALAFTPDGKRLLSAGDDTTLLVWDVPKLVARKLK